MARSTRIFKDLDFNFTAHPVTGDVARRYDENAIKASVKHLVLTGHYERPFHSEIGSPIRDMLFENVTPLMIASLRRAIEDIINNYEPRVDLLNVNVFDNLDNNAISVTIVFKIKNTSTPIQMDLMLKRTR
jgi:phage baseplate assembly protein W